MTPQRIANDIYPMHLSYDVDIQGRQEIPFGLGDTILGTFVVTNTEDAIWFVRVEKSAVSKALGPIDDQESVWYMLNGKKIEDGFEGWGELVFKRSMDGVLGGDSLVWEKYEEMQASIYDPTKDVIKLVASIMKGIGGLAEFTVKEAAKVVISRILTKVTTKQLMQYVNATKLDLFFDETVTEKNIVSMMGDSQEYALLMEAYLEYAQPKGIGLLTFTREIVSMMQYAQENNVSKCILNQNGAVVVVTNGRFAGYYELTKFVANVDSSNVISNTKALIEQYLVDKTVPSDTSNTDAIGYAPSGVDAKFIINLLLRQYANTDLVTYLKLVLDRSTMTIDFPNELIKVNEGVSANGEKWTKYHFSYRYDSQGNIMYILHLQSHDDAEGQVYLSFAKAGDQVAEGNHDEVYRKAQIEQSTTGKYYFYLSSGTALAIVYNTLSTYDLHSLEWLPNPEDLPYHPVENDVNNFLYWDASQNNIVSAEEWRESIHFEERFAANDDENLPQSAADAVKAGFEKLPSGDSKYHQLDASKKEFEKGSCLKYVHSDGREAIYEVILDNQNQKSVESDTSATRLLTLEEYPLIGPTFNYSPNDFSDNPLEFVENKFTHNSIAHYFFDMLPYYWWGNVPS